MKAKDLALILFVAVCTLLVGATVVAAFEEKQPETRGPLLQEIQYSVSLGTATTTPEPTVVVSPEPGHTPEHRGQGRGASHTPTPTQDEARDPTSDF